MIDRDKLSSEAEHSEAPPPGVRAMALVRWILVATMAVIATLSVAYSFGLMPAARATAAETQYYCPMHPQVVQDHPGDCPICSMTLVPKQGGKTSTAPSSSGKAAGNSGASSHTGHRHDPSDPYFCPMHPEETAPEPNARCPMCKMKLEKRAPAQTKPPAAPPPATATAPSSASLATAPAVQGVPGLIPVELGLDRVQLIGVRTATASIRELAPELRTVGVIAVDESKIARVHTRFSGWIEQLAAATTGQKVKKGQTLASVYNLELLPAQQEFLAANQWNAARAARPASGATANLAGPLEQDARTRLELLGMSPAEVDRIAKTGKPLRAIAVTAPITGYVTRKNVARGAFVEPGMELFEIADLSKVWLLADVYEYDAARVALGQRAHIAVGAYPGESMHGQVTFVYPTVDPQTRTLRLRIELANAGLKLRPGMYSDVRIELGEAKGVVVPRDAVVDTGDHQYVFIAKDGGRFEPRLVRVGTRANDQAQILEGLAAGEVVVTTANFLIDSESRLRAAIEGSSTAE